MPWECVPKKDVSSRRKSTGRRLRTVNPSVSEWGNPPCVSMGFSPCARSGTWGTEISKYPEEKKSNERPLVSDERKGLMSKPQFIVGLQGQIHALEEITEHCGIGDHRG